MKKWLVGLLAAGLCAASAWAASYSLVTSMAEFSAGNYVITGEKAAGEEHAMLNEVDSGDFILQQTDAATIVDGVISDPDASIVWTVAEAENGWTIYNEAAGGYVKFPGGTKNKATTESSVTDDSTWTISFTEGISTVDNVGTPGRKLQYNKSQPRFACYTSVQTPLKFYKEGTLAFSVSLEPAEDFPVVEGEDATVTATPKNALGDVTYAWTVDGVPAETDGNVLALSTETVGGPYEVVCVATDGGAEGVTAEASVSYTVVAAPQAYTVTVADGIENGSVAVWDGETELVNPAEVLEGTTLTVVATPATRSYKVESITVTGETSGEIALANGEFAMPAENVFVTATFVERSGDLFEKITSVEELEAGAYVITGAAADGTEYAMLNEANTSTATDHIKRKETPEDVSDDSISGPEDSIIWTLAKDDAGWTIYNAEGGYVCYVPNMGNSANLEEEPSSRSHWTIAATEDGLFETTNVGDSTRVLRYNQSNPRFACYDKPTSGKSLAFYKRSGIGTFSVVLDPAEDFDVIQDEEASIAATPKNAVGEVTYAWTVDGVAAETDGPVLPLSTGVVGGPHEVVCVATDAGRDGETATASVSYTVVAPPALYTVSIAEGIENGEVALNLDGTPIETPIQLLEDTGITVVATPAAGFKLEAITVNGTPIEGDTFVLAADSVVGATFVESSTVTATYTVESTSAVSVGGTVPDGSEATYSSTYTSKYQLLGGNSMTLTLKGYKGATIKKLALSMHSNKSSGSGSLSVKDGETEIAAIADAAFSDPTWNGAYSQDWVDIEVPVDAVVDGDVVITLAASVKSLYCQSFTVEYEPGEPVFSVSLDDNGFELPLGDGTTVTATAENGEGEITYSWSSETPELNGSGPELEIPGTLAEGEYAATVTATDSSEPAQTATAELSFKVVPPPALYWVSIAEGIENGSVSLNLDGNPVETPIQLLEGTEVTVEATANEGFTPEEILVNGASIGGDTFTVAGDSVVSATFTAIVDYATLPFLEEDTPFTGPWQNPKVAGVAVDGLGTDYNSATDGRGARFDTTGDWLQIKFEGTPGTLSYALKGNGTTNTCVFIVQESATGGEEDWSTLATYPSEETPLKATKTEFSNELKADSRFVRFLYELRVVGNVALYDVYISNGGFSVGVDRNGFEIEQGRTATVTAEAKNGVEPYEYLWNGGSTPELGGSGPVLEIPGTLEQGEYSVTVTATDSSAEPQTAEAVVTFTVVEPKPTYTVSIADGIENGEVSIRVDGEAVETPAVLAEGTEVTVVATPAAGFKKAEIAVNGVALAGDTFTVAEDAVVSATFAERGDEFVKITSLDELEEGEYVITGAASDGEYAMLAQLSDTQKVYIKQKDTPEVVEADTIASPEDAIVWTLAKIANGWTIHNDAIGYVGYVASDNTAGAEEEASAKSTWTFAESDGLFQVLNVGNASRYLLYNIDATRFACYTSIQAKIVPLAFYKKSGPAVFGVSVDKTGFEVTQGTADSVTAAAKNGAEPYSYVWTSGTEALNGVEGSELAIPGTLEPGPYSATVTATDSSAEPQTATAEVTFTVVAPLPVYTVTVAEGIENGTVTVDKTEAEAGETVTVTATPDANYNLVAILVNGTAIEGNTFAIAGDSVVSATFAEIVKYPVTIDDAIEHGTIAADKTEAEAGETVTLTATPDDGWKLDTFLLGGEPFEGNTFAMPEGEALVSAVFVERTYVRYEPVASATGLEVGAEYLVVAHKDDAFTSALKNEDNGQRIAVDEVTIAEDGSITTDNDAIVWEIRAGAAEGQYVLYNASGVYAAAVSDGNYAQVLADGEDPLAQWTIDLSEAPVVKIASMSYSERFLQRNNDKNNKFFAAYTGSQTTPSLYKKAGPPAFSVGFDKEDGFTVPFGTADSVTAAADNGVEPYGYVWSGDLSGEGATLAIPADLAAGDYTVTVTATDASETPQEATASISFTVVPLYSITIDPAIVGGTVVADKETAAEGELVTLTVTPDPGFDLVAVFVNGGEIEGTTFEMPAGDVTVSAGFAEVVDYATLPFIDKDTPYPGPWKNAEVPGLTNEGLDSDYDTGGVYGAKFRTTGAWMQLKFRGTPGTLSFGIKGNGVNEEEVSTFVVRESADGETWTPVAVFTSDDNLVNSRQDVSYTLSEDSRYVQFLYQEKVAGNVGIYDVYIGEAGESEATVTVTGDTTVTLGGTFALELGLENYTGEYAWVWAPETVGYVDPETATWWWTPTETQVGETEVTFSAMDGDRTIASATVTLTVVGEPAEPEVTLIDGETTVELDDYFLLQFALSNYEGAFTWTADVGEIDGDGYFTWTPTEPGVFPVVISAMSGEETIASTTVTLTVTGEPPAPVPARITAMEFDMDAGILTLTFIGDGTAVYGTDDLNGTWEPLEALIDGDTAIVQMTKRFIRIR